MEPESGYEHIDHPHSGNDKKDFYLVHCAELCESVGIEVGCHAECLKEIGCKSHLPHVLYWFPDCFPGNDCVEPGEKGEITKDEEMTEKEFVKE